MEDVQSSYLQTIPEDRSDTRSVPPMAPRATVEPSEAASSIRAVRAGADVGSILSGHGADIGSPEQPAAPQPKPTVWERFWGNKKVLAILLVSLTLLAGTVVAIVVGQNVSDGAEELESADPSGDDDDEVPVLPSPEPILVDDDIVNALDEFLTQLVQDEEILRSESTPQGQARRWMLTEDLLRDDVMDEGVTRVHQRYALVTLYYATNGAAWLNTFLSTDTSECRWFNVTCTTNDSEQLVVERVHLQSNNLDGTLPTELAEALPGLRELILGSNQLRGSIPAEWFANDGLVQNLFHLDLSENRLTGRIPAGLWSLPVLRFVYFSSNQLTGPIDSSAATTSPPPWLEDVWLYDNALTGELPTWLPDAFLLLKWLTSNNQIGGSLPATLPPRLYHFDLSENALTGPLPASFWTSQLRILYVDGNALSGNLPATTNATRTEMEMLWLHNNTFTGEIPQDFGIEWTQLGKLLLHLNPGLTGDLGPSLGQCQGWWPDIIRLEADCLSGVECDCCTLCV